MTIAPANLTRSLVQSSSSAKHGAQVTAKDKAAYKVSEPALPPDLPAIMVLPAHPIDINRRALAQSTRYIAKTRKTSDSVRVDLQKLGGVTGDVGIIPARDSLESYSTPKGQDFDAAGILLAVSQEPRAISTTPELGDMPAATVDEPEEDAYFKSSWTCPVSTCMNHHRFLLKLERDKHIMTHFGGMSCDHIWCRSYSFKQKYGLQDLKNHIRIHYCTKLNTDHYKDLKCQICFHELSRSDYLDHLDDCIVHILEHEASGKAPLCPKRWYDHLFIDFLPRYLRSHH